jgi:hypothetical protein
MQRQGSLSQIIIPALITFVMSACGIAQETPLTVPTQETTRTAQTQESSSVNEANSVQWVGHTKEGNDFAFMIEGSDVTSITTDYQIGGCGAATTVMGNLGTVISDGFEITFESINSGAGPDSQYTAIIAITGQFSSEFSASGTMTVTGTPCGNLHTEWEASKGEMPLTVQTQEIPPTEQTLKSPPTTQTQEASLINKPNAGTWVGQTQEGNNFELTIEGSDVASITMDYQIEGCGATITLAGNLATITSRGFEIQTETSDFGAGPDPQFTAVVIIMGEFSSASSASGNIVIIGSPCGDFYTEWEASQG